MKQNIISVLVLCCVLSLLCSLGAEAAICANDLIRGYPASDAKVIESTVVDGSTLFLQAAGSIMTILYEAEKGSRDGLNTPAVLDAIDLAVSRLKSAKEKYLSAAQMGSAIAAELVNSAPLRSFDYDSFAAGKKLILPVAEEIKKILSAGDVTVFYKGFAAELENLTLHLESLKTKLMETKDSVFYKAEYQELLQILSHTMLLGNYATVLGEEAFDR